MKDFALTTFEDAPFELIDGDRGRNYPKQTDFSTEGYCLFLNANNVTKQGFSFSNCQFISEQKDSSLRKGKLCRGDIVLTTRGTLGNSAYYNGKVQFDNIRINSGMVILRCNRDTLLPDFIFQFLRSSYFYGQVNALRSGAAQPQLPIRDMKKIRFPLPSIHIQTQIIATLSAYDDLIENNRRRIQLLEQAAQLLYREWFVHLRFPGHEQCSISDGVPEGWERTTLGDFAPLQYGKALKKDDRIPGPFPVYGSSGPVGSHTTPLISGPAIILGRKGNVGSVYWTPGPCHPIDTVYFIPPERSSLFLYYTLQYMNFISTDVAVPGLNRNFAHSRTLLVGDENTLHLFDEQASTLHQQIGVLQKQNTALAKARDLLLPRLMSGELPPPPPHNGGTHP